MSVLHPGGCGEPHTIHRGREDFRIYMSKMLERSSALDTFRPGGHTRALSMGAISARTQPINTTPTPTHLTDGRHSKYVTSDEGKFNSPGFYRDCRHWPRAGKAVGEESCIPLNLSGESRGLLSSLSPHDGKQFNDNPLGTVLTDSLMLGRGARTPERRRGSVGKSGQYLSSHMVLDDQSEAREEEKREEKWDKEEGQDGNESFNGDGWKAAWSRRLHRGPLQSDYQSSYRWPPARPLMQSSPVVPERQPPPAPLTGSNDSLTGGDGVSFVNAQNCTTGTVGGGGEGSIKPSQSRTMVQGGEEDDDGLAGLAVYGDMEEA
ncbi:unnamed protein product, partial [Choristocarpus tenellus]